MDNVNKIQVKVTAHFDDEKLKKDIENEFGVELTSDKVTIECDKYQQGLVVKVEGFESDVWFDLNDYITVEMN